MPRQIIIDLKMQHGKLRMDITHDPPLRVPLSDPVETWAARISEVVNQVLLADQKIREDQASTRKGNTGILVKS